VLSSIVRDIEEGVVLYYYCLVAASSRSVFCRHAFSFSFLG
jgi:hypothetical protein